MCTVQLTEKINPYLLRTDKAYAGEFYARVKVADKKILETTGVTMPSNMVGTTVATAEYTYKYEINPLGLLMRLHPKAFEVKEGRATFLLYDDGWRLKD